MKKNYFKLLSLSLAALTLGACSSNDEETANGEGTRSYVAVNFLTAGSGMSRAISGYEDGTDAENEVTTARVYFFDASGKAYQNASGKNSTAVTYTKTANTKESETVEEMGEAVIVIDGTTSALPASLVAVLNAPSDLPESVNTLADLRKVIDGCQSNGKFIMTNSVYNTTYGETPVDGHIGKSADDAKANPVDIYVERVAAKVTAKDSRTDAGVTAGLFNTGKKVTVDGVEREVYAKIVGWNVADYNKRSYLVKNLEASYTNLGFTPYISNDFHRSFWATSVPFSDSNVRGNWKYSEISNALTAKGTSTYTQECTPKSVVSAENNGLYLSSNGLTKAIFAAKLIYFNGSTEVPVEVCEYYGTQYVSADDVLTTVASKYAHTYYTKSTASGNTVYTGLKASDIEFVTSTLSTVKDYEVVAAVKSGVDLYVADASAADGYKAVETATVNAELAKNPASIRKGGMTYYYVPIAHFGSEGSLGEYGVVRNHSYVLSVSALSGFGTPVFDENKVIIPTLPTDENSYVAARINILAWRLVNQNVNLTVTGK